MRKTALPAAFAVAAMLAAVPAYAQRVFVSGSGSDSNPCTYAAPCRTFQHAFNTVPANGEIDVLDPAGYGALTITHGVSIQAHGFGGITQAAITSAITINDAVSSDVVSLNGLLIDGAGSGTNGIYIAAAGSVQILNCVIRHFSAGIEYQPTNNPVEFLVSNTVASDNSDFGIDVDPANGISANPVTLSGITANDNGEAGVNAQEANVMIANSVLSNNGEYGLHNGGGATTWLAKATISGNAISGVAVQAGVVNSYGDNDINGNTTDVSGSLMKISTQ